MKNRKAVKNIAKLFTISKKRGKKYEESPEIVLEKEVDYQIWGDKRVILPEVSSGHEEFAHDRQIARMTLRVTDRDRVRLQTGRVSRALTLPGRSAPHVIPIRGYNPFK